jgi:DNA-binding transcriptional LysR family regulator
MNWDDLKVFLALARLGSTRAASQQLGIATTTITRRIASLEEQTGVRLFDRMPGGYRLSPAGQELLAKSAQIEQHMIDIERDIRGRDKKEQGVIKISISQALLDYIFMPVLKSFSDEHPEITLELDISNRFTDIKSLEADFAIRLTDNPSGHLDESLFGRKLAGYEARIYKASTYKINKQQGPVWIGWNKHVSFSKWLHHSPYPDAPVRYVINDFTAIAKAVEAGAGISYLPEFIGDTLKDTKRLKNAKQTIPFECWAVTHKDLKNAKRIKLLFSCLSQYF